MINNLIRKIRFSGRLLLAFILKQQKLLFLGFLVGISGFWIFTKLIYPKIVNQAQIIGLVGRYDFLQLPQDIQLLISHGLTKITPDGEVLPDLAESWEIQDNGKTYIFTLKENLYWQDHQLIKAKDIKYNFSDVTTTVLDDRRLKFNLKEPFSPFLTVMSKPVFKQKTIGNGDYLVKKIKSDNQYVRLITLKNIKNKNSSTISYRFYPSEEALKLAFKLGEINLIKDLISITDFTSWKQIKIEPIIKTDRWVGIFLNQQKTSLSDKSFRQVLNYGLKKDFSNRLYGPIADSSTYYNSDLKQYDYDRVKAKKLIEESPENKTSEIELSCLPSLIDVAEIIKSDWEQLGLTVKIKTLNSLDEDYEALLAIQEIPVDPDQYIFWHSTQKLNISHYKSVRVDYLLEEGRKTFDLAKRKEIYQEFQRAISEDVPVIFLYHPTLYRVSR